MFGLEVDVIQLEQGYGNISVLLVTLFLTRDLGISWAIESDS